MSYRPTLDPLLECKSARAWSPAGWPNMDGREPFIWIGGLGARQRDALSHTYSCTVDEGDVDESELADAGS
jgi:hypothetical protein